MGLMWDDVNDIAFELLDAHPEVDPLDINFVELLEWVIELPDFDDDPDAASEEKLEAIVLAWNAQL